MKFAGAAAVLLATQASASDSKVTPVQKVIQLMEGMLAKGKSEKHDEQVQYAAYKQFCDDTSAEKKKLIAAAEEQIEVLKADIEKYTADAEQLGREIAAHEEDISVWTGDMKAATKVREIEKADYDTTHADYSESIDALERAIAVLKKQAYTRAQASSLIQVEALTNLKMMPEEVKQTLTAFLDQKLPSDDAGLDVSAPEAAGYEFQSSGVIEMLEKLLDKFTAERTALEKEETASVQAYEMMMQDLNAQVAQATTEKDAKTDTKAKKLGAKATAEGDLKDTTDTMEADKTYLADLTATCDQKASDFEARQQLRTEELEAINKAIEIVSSGAVSGSADKHLPAMIQRPHSSFAQLRSAAGTSDKIVRNRVADFLQTKAKELQSRVLLSMAEHAEEDPFVKVRKMIKDLIVRLMDEANQEAEHKGWCDTELATNEQTRKEKTDAVETLHSEIDQLKASIAKGTEEIAELTQAVTDLQAAMTKATELRGEEKEKNAATIADAQAAQTAVAQALTVLKEFYAKAAEATAFVQQKSGQEPPPIFDSPYKGMQSENGGVVGMLEVIQSDFARLESDTAAEEATSQKEYDTFMTDSKIDKESKETDIEHKTSKKQNEEQALVTKETDLEGTQKELNAALAYFDKLKPSCVEADVSYEDRVQQRKEEIESLQEALKILNGEDIA